MKIISFDLSGKFAHFRKYFSNSTALSYTIPPRTVITGILAAVMGYEKDSYYDALSRKNLKIAVGVLSPLKKSVHRVNNLMIKSRSLGDFMGEKHHTQSPIEIITPDNLISGNIVYRIYFLSEDIDFRDSLIDKLSKKESVFNISFGAAQFFASISNTNIYYDSDIEENYCENELISFNSAVYADNVKSIVFDINETWKYNFIEEDLLPMDFLNKSRELESMEHLLYTTDNFPLKVKFTGNFYRINKNNQNCFIQFL